LISLLRSATGGHTAARRTEAVPKAPSSGLRPDRLPKFAFAELHGRSTGRGTANFLRRLIDAVLYRIHTVLTERAIEGAIGSSPMASGTHFTAPANKTSTLSSSLDLAAAVPSRVLI